MSTKNLAYKLSTRTHIRIQTTGLRSPGNYLITLNDQPRNNQSLHSCTSPKTLIYNEIQGKNMINVMTTMMNNIQR